MPHRSGQFQDELKENLAGNGEVSANNVQPRRGQVQDQTSSIVNQKALEQPLVNVGGVNLRGKSTTKRTAGGTDFRPRFRETDPGRDDPRLSNIQASAKGRKGGGLRKPAFDAATQALGPTMALSAGILANERTPSGLPKKIGTSTLTEKDGVSILRGPKKKKGKATGGVRRRKSADPFTREGRSNIFGTLGEILEDLPERLKRGRIARSTALGAKGIRKDITVRSGQITALAKALESLQFAVEEEGGTAVADLKTNIGKQLASLLQGGPVGGGNTEVDTIATLRRLFEDSK